MYSSVKTEQKQSNYKYQTMKKLILLVFCLAIFAGCKKERAKPVLPPDVAVSSITPDKGAAGSTITITGSGFSADPKGNKVTINGVEAEVVSATATSLTVKVPENAGSGKVVVTVGDKTFTGPDFQSVTPPVDVKIDDLSPSKGPGLTEVTISGSGFSAVASENKVTFNGVDAQVVSASKTSLTVIVPLSSGTGKVEVKMGSKTGVWPVFTYEYIYRVSTFAGMANKAAAVDGLGIAAGFQFPTNLTVDPSGNVYVSELSCIRKITPAGQVSTYAGVLTYQGTTLPVGGFRDGDKSNALFKGPAGLKISQSGVFYVADRNNFCVRKISNDGMVSTFTGTPAVQGYQDGNAGQSKFKDVNMLVLDGQGNTYVSDQRNFCIRKINPSGEVSTFVGSPANGLGYEDGQGVVAKFEVITGMVIDSKGNFFVTDRANNCIRKITPSGLVSTYAGVQTDPGYVNGTLSVARFSAPSGLAIDSYDNLYVSESGTIRKISAGGLVSTFAGSGVKGFADGPVNMAQFKDPRGIVVSPDGKYVYVADYGAHCIRKIGLQ